MKNILVAVTGLSPQIITETLYALYRKDSVSLSFLPLEYHIITTTTGVDLIRNHVFDTTGQRGALVDFCRDYGLPPVTHSAFHVHEMKDEQGDPLNDIRNNRDNDQAVDQICSLLRSLTQVKDTRLFVSMAGGRKTMGYYMGYALSLFGRTQDILTHVLVSAEHEAVKDFYYPPPSSRILSARDGSQVDAATAHIELAEIPYVRLRYGMPTALLEGKSHFSEVVERANLVNGPVSLTFDFADRSIVYGGQDKYRLALTSDHFSVLSFLYALKKFDQDEFMPGYRSEWERMVNFLHNAFKGDSNLENKIREKLGKLGAWNDVDVEEGEGENPRMLTYLEPTKSRLKKDIVNFYGRDIAEKIIYGTHYERSGETIYTIGMLPTQIRFMNADESRFFSRPK